MHFVGRTLWCHVRSHSVIYHFRSWVQFPPCYPRNTSWVEVLLCASSYSSRRGIRRLVLSVWYHDWLEGSSALASTHPLESSIPSFHLKASAIFDWLFQYALQMVNCLVLPVLLRVLPETLCAGTFPWPNIQSPQGVAHADLTGTMLGFPPYLLEFYKFLLVIVLHIY